MTKLATYAATEFGARKIYGMDGEDDGEWFVCYVEDCFSPPLYAIRAESFEQAIESLFYHSDLLPEMLEPVTLDDLRTCYGYKGSDDDVFEAAMNGGCVFHDDGNLYDVESVKMFGPCAVWPEFVCGAITWDGFCLDRAPAGEVCDFHKRYPSAVGGAA